MAPARKHVLRVGTLVLPNEPWRDLVARWRRLEDGGVDSIWSCDHFTNPHRPGQPWFEAWTGLAGLAASTSRVRLGLLVGAIVSRSPVLFAREALTVDHLSGGRLEIGLGAGGAPTDQLMWGVEEWSLDSLSPGWRSPERGDVMAGLPRRTLSAELPVKG